MPPEANPTFHTIVIVGGGFSGTLTAVHLLRGAWENGLRVVLVNRSGPLARGVAYGTRSAAHVLNVPAARMSAFPDDEEHFLRFAQEQDPAVTPGTFVPRRIYGEYLEHILDDARRGAAASTEMEHRQAECVDVQPAPEGGARVTLDDGSVLYADRVVIAGGSYAPANPAVPDAAFFSDDPRYIRDPWVPGALDRVDPSRPVLLIGTGLTMLDIALDLDERGIRAPMHARSRRGLLPRAHRSPAVPHHPVNLAASMLAGPATARRYLHEVRKCVAECPDVDWRDVLASIRGATPALWARLPTAERARFLRHLQPYWDVHRHRAAPEIADAADALAQSGRLRASAGRLAAVRGTPDEVIATLRSRAGGQVEELRVGTVINCTGPSTNVAGLREPLLDSLLRQGLLTPDALRLGLCTADDYALLGLDGRPSDVLFYTGPLLKATHWESTAVPELRLHAARIAECLRTSASGAVRPAEPAAV